jgi:Family of unknown function (DUF5681)
MDKDRDREVGYGRPPKASRFQKGKSGNPKGRPKRDPSIAALFRKICSEKVKTNGQNGQRYMTKLEASLTQLVNKAASGDLKAVRVLWQMAAQFPELVTDPLPVPVFNIHFVDPKPKQ